MLNTTKFAVSALVAVSILGGSIAVTTAADAKAAAAKPVGCLVKTTRSPVGTMIGPWKCVGTHWEKVTVAARKPYAGLFGLGEPMLMPKKA